MAFIDFGDFLPSIRDVIEDIPSSVTDILEDTEDSLNTVASSISDVFDAILDKPVQFVLQVGTSILAPHLSPFVNAGVAAANGASGGEILKAALISAASNKIGATATNISNNVLEEINFNPTYAESFSNILGNTVKKVGKGADSGFAALSSLITELQNPIKDFTGQVLQDFEGIQSVVNKAVDQFGNAKNITEAAANVIAEDLARTFSDTTTKYLGEGFGPNVELAVFEAIGAGVKGKNVQDAYYASLNKSATNDLAKLAKDPVEKVVDGVLGEFGVIEKKDGTLVAPNGAIVNNKGNLVTKDGKVQTWDGFAGFQTLKNGESIYVFDDGSSISTGFKNNQDFVQAGVDLGSYQSVDQFQADTVRKLSDGYSVKDKFYPKLENLLGNVKINAATDTRTFTDPYSAEIEQDVLSPVIDSLPPTTATNYEIMFENLRAGVQQETVSDLQAMVDVPMLGSYKGGEFKVGNVIDDKTLKRIYDLTFEEGKIFFKDDLGDATKNAFIKLSQEYKGSPELFLQDLISSGQWDNFLISKGDKLRIEDIMLLDGYKPDLLDNSQKLEYFNNIVDKNNLEATATFLEQKYDNNEKILNVIGAVTDGISTVEQFIRGEGKTGVSDNIKQFIGGLGEEIAAYKKGAEENLGIGYYLDRYLPEGTIDANITPDQLAKDKELFENIMLGKQSVVVQLGLDMSRKMYEDLSPAAKEALENSQIDGTLRFKHIVGLPVPIPYIEDFTLGEDPTIFGGSLRVSNGIIDILGDYGLFKAGKAVGKLGKLGKAIGFGGAAYTQVLQAAGSAALEIEQGVIQALQNPEYLAGAEYKFILEKNNGDPLKAGIEVMNNAKSAVLRTGVIGGLGDTVVGKLMVTPMGLPTTKYLSGLAAKLAKGTNNTASALFTEAVIEGAEKVSTNVGVAEGLQQALSQENVFKDVVAAAGDGFYESGSAAGPIFYNSLSNPGKELLGTEKNELPVDFNDPDVLTNGAYDPKKARAKSYIESQIINDGSFTLDKKAQDYLNNIDSTLPLNWVNKTASNAMSNEVNAFGHIVKLYNNNDGNIPLDVALKAIENNPIINMDTFVEASKAIDTYSGISEQDQQAKYSKFFTDPLKNIDNQVASTLNVFGQPDTQTQTQAQAQTQANNQVSSTVNVDMVGQTGDTQTQTDTQAQTQTQTQTQNQTQTQSMQEVLNNISTKQNQVQQPMGASRLVKETVPPPVDIDYIYDFESIFATPEQEAKFINPLTGIPDVSNREKGVYEDIVNPKNEKDEEEED
jgi:hypothetical protein